MDRYPASRIALYAVLTTVSLTVDLSSKSLVFARLGGPFQSTGWYLDGWLKFELHTSLNQGALWGLGQGFALWFAALSVVAFAGIVYWLFFRGAAASLWLTTALGLISGGTLGNLYDRLGLHGVSFPGNDRVALAVRDFLHFQLGPLDWAIFNLADSFLVVGAAMLFLQSFQNSEAAVTRAESDGSPA